MDSPGANLIPSTSSTASMAVAPGLSRTPGRYPTQMIQSKGTDKGE